MVFENDLIEFNNIKESIAENVDSLNKKVNASHGILIMHMNIRSINKNGDNLCAFLDSFKIKPHILICTEIWSQNAVLQNHKINGYALYSSEGSITQADGTIIYILENIEHDCEIINIGEIKALTAKIQTSEGKIIELTAIYRPYCIKKETFIKDLESHLENSKNKKTHLILGDMNIDILKQSIKTSNYLNNYSEYGYISGINSITRLSNTGGSCIDYIFVKNDEHDIKTYTLDDSITDHKAILLTINCNSFEKYREEIPKTNYKKLVKEAGKINWDHILTRYDVNDATNLLVQNIQETMKKSEFKRRENRKYSSRKEWMTDSLVKCCKKKNNYIITGKETGKTI